MIFFTANPKRIALPLAGPGGKMAILDTKRTGRIHEGVIVVLVNGPTVTDFAFDPFNDARLACAGIDGVVRLWRLPEDTVIHSNIPEDFFAAHKDKVQIVAFHPLASNVLLTAGYDTAVKIWDLNDTSDPEIVIEVSHFVLAFMIPMMVYTRAYSIYV